MNRHEAQTSAIPAAASLVALFRAHLYAEPDPADSAYQQQYATGMIDGFRLLSLNVFATMTVWSLVQLVRADAVTMQPHDAFSAVACAVLAFAGALGLFASKSIRSPGTAFIATAALLTAATAVVTFDRLTEVARDARSTPSLLPIIVSVLILSAAILPLRPLRVLGLSALLLVTCGLIAWLTNGPIRGHRLDFVSAGTGVIVAVMVAARSTSQRIRIHQSHTSAIEAERQAERARERALLAESAITMERLAASLSHELNTPIGALKSATETLALAVQRHGMFPSGSRAPQMVEELRHAIGDSTARLTETIARIQRFANLDRSAVRLVDVNQLVRDAVALVNPPSVNQTRVKLNLQPLPQIWCRPHALSVAVASVLNTVLDLRLPATIDTYLEGGAVIVQIARPCPAGDLHEESSPGFAVVGGRVRASGWDLFAARQLARETGGALHVNTLSSGDQVVTITLPALDSPAGQALQHASSAP